VKVYFVEWANPNGGGVHQGLPRPTIMIRKYALLNGRDCRDLALRYLAVSRADVGGVGDEGSRGAHMRDG